MFAADAVFLRLISTLQLIFYTFVFHNNVLSVLCYC